jgi:hypothetical protein
MTGMRVLRRGAGRRLRNETCDTSIRAELSCLSGGGTEDWKIQWRNSVLRKDNGLLNYGRKHDGDEDSGRLED